MLEVLILSLFLRLLHWIL